MARRNPHRIDREIQRSQAKVDEARRELEAELEEPIHRYTFSIPQATPALSSAPPAEEVSATLTQILEQLHYQNQTLVDLLGAVNSLIATVLCKRS